MNARAPGVCEPSSIPKSRTDQERSPLHDVKQHAHCQASLGGRESFHLWTSETGYCERGVPFPRTHSARSGHRGDKRFAPALEQKRMPTPKLRNRQHHARQTTKPARTADRRIALSDRAVRSRPPIWWSQTGSNRRPPACKAGALPTELWPPQGSGISNQGSGKPELLIPDI